MTIRAKTESRASAACALDAKRNFIIQQGLQEPLAETCPLLYSALLFQPRVIGVLFIGAALYQQPGIFFALAAVLLWNAFLPHLNPFDAVYNHTLARRPGGIALSPAPGPRRFAQSLAGLFAIAIGALLALGWHMTAFFLEGILIAEIGALVFSGFCLGSFIFHLLFGRADFAMRTLPWASPAK